ncbi:MAG: DMT family transporter [Bacteroidetes bacterium]|uniref:DMT family transporter n=1 Tax=Candidatus Cryptobacteroides intestinigallinarum TaxID=2840767 RepID=A0A9D9HLQ6_9BACT|nr:DMT family transporter [Candidatus Cryptobacteroides intestinigallinarum]
MLAASVMWGAMAPISKFVMSAGLVGAIVVTDVRIFGAAMLFWLFSPFFKREKVEKKDYLRLFGAAMFAIVFNQGVYISGVSMTSPVDASIITTSLPIVTMILAAVFLKEPVTVRKAVGVFLGMSGALLLVFGNRLMAGEGTAAAVHGTSNVWGDILCLAAQCSYALYLVLFKDLIGKYSPVTLMKWMFTFASVIMLPLTAGRFFTAPWASVPAEQYAGLGFILFCGTFLCYFLVPIGQKTLRPTLVAMYNYVQPVVATFIAVIWGMDSFNLIKLIAVILVFCGVLLVNRSKSRSDIDNEDRAARKAGKEAEAASGIE